jgi:cytochrome c oxidase assembly protein subunit 15
MAADRVYNTASKPPGGIMATDLTTRKALITLRHSYLLLAASIMTCLLVALGGIVCATESGAGCPDWPGCYGRIVPPPQMNAIIEYTHRLVAALTTPLILAAAAVSWRKARSIRWVSRPLALAVVFVLAVIVFGAFAVLTGLPPLIAALDLSSALITLTLVLIATVVAFARRADPDLPDRLSARGGLARLSLVTLAAVFGVHVSGVLVAGKGSLTRCLGWPMWRVLPDDRSGWGQVARLTLAVAAALLIVAVVIQAWRTKQGVALRTAATAAAAAFLVEMAVSAAMLAGGTSPLLLVIHVVAATALWALLVVLAVLAGIASASEAQAGVARPGEA